MPPVRVLPPDLGEWAAAARTWRRLATITLGELRSWVTSRGDLAADPYAGARVTARVVVGRATLAPAVALLGGSDDDLVDAALGDGVVLFRGRRGAILVAPLRLEAVDYPDRYPGPPWGMP